LDIPTRGIDTDTRSLQSQQIFLALRGTNFDGHDFVGQAAEMGAIAAIVDHPVACSLPQLVVPDTLAAYQQIAAWWRDQFEIPVIGVTGSFGKTTTKELIAAILGKFGSVLKTQFNYNNEIGVPKTLLELDKKHHFAVIEMSMRSFGEIAILSEITKPTIGVITIAGTAHIGRLGSVEAIAQAKCELLATMPQSSTAVLNYDSTRLMCTAAKVWSGPTVTYGLSGGDLRGRLIDPQTLQVAGQILPLPLPGQHNATNFLGAIAVAQVLGLDWSFLRGGLQVDLPAGRAKRLELAQEITFLDETYNAGLESMLAALDLLATTPGQRRIAVLGTMKELGEMTEQYHHQVGAKARDLGLEGLFVLADDPEAGAIAVGARPKSAECFTSHSDLITRLREFIQPGDTVLFKASRSVKLDTIIDALLPNYTRLA
jgi:UDP-N-acetylmuramoyl-tripeptide--D-alanyl-D-alanine ligase